MVRNLATANMIHKTDVYFEVVRQSEDEEQVNGYDMDKMRHGEIYIYQDQIYLFDGKRWYRARVQDIKEIKSLTSQKQILIHFWDFDLVLFCREYTHLMALRDFLFLSQNNPVHDNFLLSEPEPLRGGGYDY